MFKPKTSLKYPQNIGPEKSPIAIVKLNIAEATHWQIARQNQVQFLLYSYLEILILGGKWVPSPSNQCKAYHY